MQINVHTIVSGVAKCSIYMQYLHEMQYLGNIKSTCIIMQVDFHNETQVTLDTKMQMDIQMEMQMDMHIVMKVDW